MSSQLAGNPIVCPSCGHTMIVPPCAEESELERVWDSLDERQQKLEAAERELAQTKSVLVEVLQQFRASKNALEQTRTDAAATEKTCTQLRTRLRQLEESENHLQLRLSAAEMQVSELKAQLEQTKSQRGVYLWETQRLSDSLKAAHSRLEKLSQEAEERERILGRAQEATDRLSVECREWERAFELKSVELVRAFEQIRESENAKLELETERDELRGELGAVHDLEGLRAAQAQIAELAGAAKEREEQNQELRAHCQCKERDCERAKEENFQLRIQLAALREAANDSRLYEENQLLRGVIERNNEQLRSLANASFRRRFVSVDPPEDSSLRASLRWLLGLFFGNRAESAK